MLPCLDAPGHKSTYSARVTAPSWATVLMSALAQEKGEGKGLAEVAEAAEAQGVRTFTWDQPVRRS